MTAMGDSKTTGEALGYIKNAAIGLTVILVAYAITAFIAEQLINAINLSK